MRIAAVDQGTTSTRVLVAGPGEAPRVAASRRHATTYPGPGRVEQDARELLANIRAVLAAAEPFDAIALANQGESCLAWDAETGEPLSPVIVWQDVRTLRHLAALRDDGAEAEALARSGLPLDPYFSAAKLGGLLREEGAVRAALTAGRLRLGTTDAFFLQHLTGTAATDRATASRTGLMNIATGEWDAELCRLFGVPEACLPPIRANTAGFGSFGGIPVAAAIVDQQAALYGHGCRAPGEAKITFGTGAFALAVAGPDVPRAASGAGLLPTVAWDLGAGSVYAVDGGVPEAGAAVEWALRAGLADSLDGLSGFADPPAVARGLVFVPGFSGLGCPDWDRSARPLILGLTPDMTRADIVQALLEGIAFLTARVVAALAGQAGAPARLSIDGGLSRNAYFAQVLADCCGVPVAASAFADLTAWGAARLAADALGVVPDPPRGDGRLYAPRDTFRAEWTDRFAAALERCRGWA